MENRRSLQNAIRVKADARVGRYGVNAFRWGGGHLAFEMNGPEGIPPESAGGDRDHEQVVRWRRALLTDPFEPAALAALIDRARAKRDWVRLALLQARRFAVATADAERAAIALELADDRAARAAQPERGARPGSAAASRRPRTPPSSTSGSPRSRARAALPALLESLERVIAARAEQVPVEALLTAASLYRECGDAQHALAHLERATACAPEQHRRGGRADRDARRPRPPRRSRECAGAFDRAVRGGAERVRARGSSGSASCTSRSCSTRRPRSRRSSAPTRSMRTRPRSPRRSRGCARRSRAAPSPRRPSRAPRLRSRRTSARRS